MTIKSPLDLTVYVVTDPLLSKGRSHEEVVSLALEGGASAVQLRDKQASTRELCEIGLRIKSLTEKWGALFIVNDRVDIAVAIDADGVHVGQDDLPALAARRILGPGKVLGVSTENGDQARQAAAQGASYVAIGPIYEARGSKADAGAPIGPKAITDLRKHTSLPIVAIGGIKHDRVAEIARAGAAGVAVISAIVGADDIVAATREMKRLFLEGKG
ncbi:MAG: thiamine-phosphate pyrophosphorylase [Dehalococcoidia bacterium]|nr:thiamine-phosphate pyrophosphorylase [Dehalococcoidia bacterium]